MFRRVSQHLFWWPVAVLMPHPERAGTIEEQSFEMRFEAMPVARAREIEEARGNLPPKERAAHDFDFLFEICRNWRDVEDDDGAVVPFSHEELSGQLQYPWFRDGVLGAYGRAISGQAARLGN